LKPAIAFSFAGVVVAGVAVVLAVVVVFCVLAVVVEMEVESVVFSGAL
jgi:hypothetical protein